VRCPACSTENPPGFRFCGACGAALLQREEPEVRKTVTVVFADVVGSTELGERLDPESVRSVMRRYFERMKVVLDGHGGTVEKFIGDAVVGVFGVPMLHEDDALRAVQAAHEMRGALAELNEELGRDHGLSLDIRIGVNTGEVVAGDPASAHSFVVGDAVNVSARLEQAAAPGEILIGEETLRLARDALLVEGVPAIEAKGKAGPVAAYRVLDVIAGAPPFVRRLDSPLVGREVELAALGEVFEGAYKHRRCELVTVLGEAGLGKTRLVAEFLALVGDSPRILTTRCIPYGEGITFWPVAEAVRAAAGITGADSAEAAVGRIGTVLGEGEDGGIARERLAAAIGLGEAAGEIQETFWAVRRFLESLAREQPLVLVVEDIHWAEAAFLDLLEYLAGFSRDHPVVILCTARPELRDSRPGWGAGATLVVLRPLSDEDSARLIDNLLGHAGIAGEVAGRIAATAEGNPLFVEEMLRMLIDEGRLVRDDGYWKPLGDLAHIEVPGTIHALLAARLDHLEDEERVVMQRAAVAGKTFYWGAVASLAPTNTSGQVATSLQALLRKELIVPEASAFAGQDAFRFSHILVRDAAYDSIPKRVRAELHEAFASWLEGVAGRRMPEYEEIVGYHLERAYRYLAELGPVDARAAEIARRAGLALGEGGRSALARGDAGAAVNLLSRAVELLPENDGRRAELLPDLADALYPVGEVKRLEAVIEAGTEVARAHGNRALESRMLIRSIQFRSFTDPSSRFEVGLAELERLLPDLEALGDEAALAEAWLMLGQFRQWLGRMALSEEALERGITLAERAGLQRKKADALARLCWSIEEGPTPVDRALDRLEDVLHRARGSRYAEAEALSSNGRVSAMLGRFEEARELVARAKSIFDEFGLLLPIVAVSSLALAEIELLAGDPAAAEPELRRGFEVLEQAGGSGQASSRAATLARVLYAMGHQDEALRFTEVSERLASRDDFEPQVWLRQVRAGVMARQGRHEEAERIAREAVELVSRTDWLDRHGDTLMALGEVLHLGRRKEEAAAAVDEAIKLYERKGNLVSAGRARAVLEELRAEEER
jgi:class 3 adenylate cyclase/tetratricopeptide (TPR) repeat protein